MKRLTSYITLNEYSFKGVVEVEIESSWSELTDTAKITLPRKLSFQGRDIALGDDPLFKRGDKVEIWLGYDGQNNLEFTGYITMIEVKTPVVLTCEDASFLLKRSAKTISEKNANLGTLLSKVLPNDMAFESVDMVLGPYRLRNATPAMLLEDLRKKYGLYAYFQGDKLLVGFPYGMTGERALVHNFQFQKNIVSDNLSYKAEQDTRIKVKAVSMNPKNQKTEIEVGDQDGELRTFYFYDLPKTELEQAANEALKTVRYTGWSGDFDAFGVPFVSHGDIVNLSDPLLDRRGAYLVKKITTTFGQGGFRRKIQLDRTA